MRRGTALTVGGVRRPHLAAGLALVVAVAVVIGLVLNAGPPPSARSASDPGAVSGAATVQRRDLVQTDTESGTLSYGNPQTVYNRLSGTITWLPSVGQVIKPGGTLFRVDGEPVMLMNGSTPAYRTLTATDSDGADVLQLNRNLVALGFNATGISVDNVWQSGTTLGVELLQQSLGEAATGSLSLGQIVFLPGDQLVATVDGTLGSTGGASGSAAGTGTGSSAAATTVATARPELVSLQTVACPTATTTSSTSTTTTATTTGPVPCAVAPMPRSTTGPPPSHRSPGATRPAGPGGPREVGKQTLAALLALLKAEVAQLKAERGSSNPGRGKGSGSGKASGSGSGRASGSGSGKSSGSGSGSGSGGGSAQAILQTTSTKLVVTVDLGASVQSEAVIGERVTVQMPAGNTVDGRITAVSPVAQASSGSGGGSGGPGSSSGGSGGGNGGGSGSSSSTIPVTITLRGHHTGAGLDQAAVSVNFVKQRANNVLSVPVTALLATSGGNYALQTAAAPHRMIPVTPGLFAAGDVQISGSGVYPGLRVTDSQG